jgi:ABC-2 type transport system permease protein
VNYFTDAVAQPLMSALIEIVLWFAVFGSIGESQIAGFGRDSYLSYAIWAAFISRITSNWMYEFRMIDDIETGAVNTLLVRPASFFEYYLSQFLGYKIVTSLVSLAFPLAAALFFGLPVQLARLPGALLLVTYYLVLVHCLSFCVATLAFRLNKAAGFTVAKNLGLWLFSGELFPLDLFKGSWRTFMASQPFANAVFVPVAYLTGRAGNDVLARGFLSTTAGIVFFGGLSAVLWRRGLRTYSGTGA